MYGVYIASVSTAAYARHIIIVHFPAIVYAHISVLVLNLTTV